MKTALIVSGGWEGHFPHRVAERLQSELASLGIEAKLSDTLEVFDDPEALAGYSLILPNWTMGELSGDRTKNLLTAVRAGVGLAGLHGGAGDAFRGNIDYEWMLGGHFVGHPTIGPYSVRVVDASSPITAGVAGEFAYDSEQYYLLVDPGNHVLAETDYTYEGTTCRMPVAWTKSWGAGRIFYSALGHRPEEFDLFPDARRLAVQGIAWAAGLE